jgi:hypothetical protein
VRAIIDWIPKEQGGRSKLPDGMGSPPYSPTVRFLDTDEPWPPPVLWSFAIRKMSETSGSLRWIVDARFRVEHAPHESLRPGRPFELYEGPHCVARGQLVDSDAENADPEPDAVGIAEQTRNFSPAAVAEKC